MAWKRKAKSNRHAFRFKLINGKIHTFWTKVVRAKKDVYLQLKADHVMESIKLRGVGNTQTCSMAVCAAKQREAFPHPVDGTIDWFYTRAYVVSRHDKNGHPRECYEYAHSDSIAQLNDTKGGQQKLLVQLQERGDRIIHLRPITEKKKDTRRPARGVGDGSRTKAQKIPRGAKLRYAVAEIGGIS